MGTGFLHGISRENLTAEEVADAVGILPITGSGQVSVFSHGRGGTAIGFNPGPVQVVDIRPAVVTNTGPKGEADFSNELYWAQVWRPDDGVQKDPIVIQPDRANYAEDWWVPATNLPEWDAAGGTHLLPTDGTALVILVRLVDRGGMERFVFSRSPALSTRLTITAILAGAGAKYTVRRLGSAPADIDNSSDAAAADLGTADAVDAIGVDTNELGRAAHSHLNALGQVVDGELLHVNADGTRVYTFAAAPGPSVRFEVTVSQTGGANGTGSAAPTYSYDVTALNGQAIGSGVSVDWARPNGAVTAGTNGVAHYTSDGTLHLDWVDEVPGTVACT